MAYTWDSPHQQAAQAGEQKDQAWRRYRSTARAGQAQRQQIFDEAEAAAKAKQAEMDAENKRKSSNWLNWTALGTGLGSAFGMPWLGAGIGTLVGMGKAAASGGDILDFRSQMKYLDPRMVTGAAMGVANMPGASKDDAIRQAAKQVGVPGMATSSGRQFDDPTMGTQLQSTWNMSPEQQKMFERQMHLRRGHISQGRKNLIDKLVGK